MGITILHRLEAKSRNIKLQDGSYVKVTNSAFIGATTGKICELGIGLIDTDGKKGLFWALYMPHLLVTAWRGMHILDNITDAISVDTLEYAFYAGKNNDDDADVKEGIAILEEQLPNIAELRQKLLKTPIDDAVLNAMLKVCNDPNNGIDISISELREAAQAGIIHQTDEVMRAYQIALDAQLKHQHDIEASKQPLPEEKSFRAFCKKAKIRYLFGDPNCDWPNYWPDKRTDENLVYKGLNFKGIEDVWCTKERQEERSYSCKGHIGQPVLQLSDGRIISLERVRFLDGDMYAAIRPVKSEDELKWVTLCQLSDSPRFIGLTFTSHDNVKTEDLARGYIATPATEIPTAS